MRLSSLVLLFSFLHTGVVCAQEIYSWPKCVKEAKENHPDLVSSREKIKQSEADKNIARSGLFPQVEGDLEAGVSKGASSGQAENYAYGLTGSQLLFDGFKISHQVKEVQAEIIASQFGYWVSSSNVRLRLRKAFVELLKAQELLKITEEIVVRRKASLELVQLRYEAGREHKGALLTAEANLAEGEFEVFQARRSIALAQRRLNKELGRSEFIPIWVQGSFDVVDTEGQMPGFEEMAQGTPFLKELIARKEVARYGIHSAKADYFPEVFVKGGVGGADSDFPPGEDTWSAGVSVSLPLLDGGSRRYSVQKARSVFAQAAADERSGRDGVILTLHETWTQLQDAVEKVQVQRKFLESAEVRAEISEAQYSNGLISFDDWIIIEDALVRAKKTFLEAGADALITEANWIQAKGRALEDEA